MPPPSPPTAPTTKSRVQLPHSLATLTLPPPPRARAASPAGDFGVFFAQVEEERIELADLTRFSRLSSDREAAERLILSNEESILATLGYELVVRAPHRALSGILVSLRARRRAGDDTTGAGGGAVAGLSPSEEPILGAEAMATIESKARDFIGHALCADAPLLFSPQQLAMAGVMRGAAAAGIDLRPWLNRWLRRSGDAGTADGDQALRFEQVRKYSPACPAGCWRPDGHCPVPRFQPIRPDPRAMHRGSRAPRLVSLHPPNARVS